MPDGPDQHDGHVEPDADTEHDTEIGGADWLLAQLSGGRRARREVEPEAPNPAPAAAEDEAVIPVWYAAPSATGTVAAEPSEPSEPSEPAAPAEPAAPVASAISEPAPEPQVEPELQPEAEPEPQPAPASEAETQTEAEPEPVAPVARAAASSSAVWSLFADFDTDEPAQPAPVESDQDSDPAQAHDADDDASTSSVETEEEAAAAAGFHWGLRAGEDPAKYSSADAAADAAPFLPAPFVAAPFVAPVFGAPAAEPPRFPTPVPPPPVEDEAEPEPEPDDAEPAAASAPETSDPIDFADADTAATALLATAESEQSSFIDTQAANPALSGLVLPPAALVAPAAFAAASDPSDEAGNQYPGAVNAADATGDAQVPTDVDPTSDGTPPGGTPPDGTPPGGKPPVDRRLLWIVGVLGLVVVLVGLFFLGTRLPTMFGAAPTPTPSASKTPTPTPTPTVAPEVTGPAAAGEHPWDQLGGGECIDPYTGPWAETFTVVDCAAPHAAQLVYRGTFGGDATTAFPGEEALASQINLLCSAPGVIDVNAAGGYPDLQLQGSFPVTEEQWTTTKRYYYCFVSRSGGEPITASVAGPGPAA